MVKPSEGGCRRIVTVKRSTMKSGGVLDIKEPITYSRGSP